MSLPLVELRIGAAKILLNRTLVRTTLSIQTEQCFFSLAAMDLLLEQSGGTMSDALVQNQD